MARPKKDDKPEGPTPVVIAAAAVTGTVSVEEFRKTRDNVIQGLTGLQLAVGNLLNAYMSHCNTLLGEGGNESLEAPDLSRLGSAFAVGAPIEVTVESKKEKKKRQKKERDPDMPKRPLTAAFLYGQTARPIIKKDLEGKLAPGDKLGANAVNEEVTKRWNAMPEDEKQLWRNAYQENMVKYKQEMEEYAARKGISASAVLDEVAVGVEVESETDAAAAPKKTSTPAATKPAAKRRKTGKENGVAVVPATQSPVPPPSATKAGAGPTTSTPAKADPKKKKKEVPEKDASPEEPRKKRARKSKGAEEAEAEGVVEGEKKERKRKRKTDNA